MSHFEVAKRVDCETVLIFPGEYMLLAISEISASSPKIANEVVEDAARIVRWNVVGA